MLRPKLSVLLTVCVGAWLVPAAHAQINFDFDNIETILEDNTLDEAANRYSSVILSSLPEQGTRLGFSSSNDKLDSRTPQQNAQLLLALEALRSSVNEINEKKLSQAKQADRALLISALESSMLQANQERAAHDPLYYTQALDSIYDLLTKQVASPIRQRMDLLARLTALSKVADQAEQNLTSADPYAIELAMEKAYHAFLSTDEWNQFLMQGAQDQETINQVNRTTRNAKISVKRLFETFKRLSKQENKQDFRLGQENYFNWLKTHYQLEQKPAKFVQVLDKNLQQAQTNLTNELDPFIEQAAASEVTLVEGENNPPTTQALPKEKKQPKKKKSAKVLQLRNGQDFYPVAEQFITTDSAQDPLQTLNKNVADALSFFVSNRTLSPRDITFAATALPQYYTYSRPYLFVPPFGNQYNPKSDFYLRLPAGNTFAQRQQLNRDFNLPTRKLMISSQIVPGRYYQAEATANTSSIRRLYPSESLLNGWEVYAQRLAKRQGYFDNKEDALFLAWNEYIRALAAWVDMKLHTQEYTQPEALEFLTQTHGLEADQAQVIIKQVIANPGQAASYLIGLDALETAHDKYSKKLGKKFNEADFNNKLFQAGNVVPSWLDKELKRLYKKDSKKK